MDSVALYKHAIESRDIIVMAAERIVNIRFSHASLAFVRFTEDGVFVTVRL